MMNEKSAVLGAVVAIIQIVSIAIAAALSWHAHATVSFSTAIGVPAEPIVENELAGAPASRVMIRTEPDAAQTFTKPLASRPPAEPEVSAVGPKHVIGLPDLSRSVDLAPIFKVDRYESINGLTPEDFLIAPPEVLRHVRSIFSTGQLLGNNPHAFSKLGDSTIESPYFLSRFENGPYDLGQYDHLVPLIETFSGSFGREAVTVRRGFHSWSALNPAWADKQLCQANEPPLTCEFRIHKPSFLFIRLGSNDGDVPASFDKHMRLIVEYTIEMGVVPILGTKADRIEGPGNEINETIYEIAAEYKLPLWDFDKVAQTAPGKGLGLDGVHLTSFYMHDYSLPEAFERGHALHNLSALLVLDHLYGATETSLAYNFE